VQVVVIAGGLATRMRPRTEKVPKSLLEVAGRPFIDWQLELLAKSGATEVVMCIAHLGEMIRAHVGDQRDGMRIVYSEEPPQGLLGTAGAVRAALPVLADEFVVTYGDSYLPIEYGAPLSVLREHADCDGVMVIYKNDGKLEVSNVVTDGTWVLRYDKTGEPVFDHVDYGATALRKSVIAALPAGQVVGLHTVQRDLAARHRLRAHLVYERFFEIGSPSGLAELDEFLK
jgi:NDP-sugar pyrophosphorylase family protein